MPGYATVADLVARIGREDLIELAPVEGDEDAFDEAKVTDALLDAEGEVDSYVSGRYALPLATVPRALVRYTVDIARYHLEPLSATPLETVRQRYEDAVKFLKAVAAGTASLGDVASATPAPVSDGPSFEAPARTFTADTLRDYTL